MDTKNNRLPLLIALFVLVSQGCSLPFSLSSLNPMAPPKPETASPVAALPTQMMATPKPGTTSLGGAIPIQINVTAPEGVQVVEKAALLAPHKEAQLYTLYAGIVLSSARASLGFKADYQIWDADVVKDKPFETKGDPRLWLAIPARQTGARFIKLSDYPSGKSRKELMSN
jgi:hypothetical protein